MPERITNTPVRLTAPSRQTSGVAAAQGSNLPCQGVVIKAICPGNTIYIGTSSGVTAADGFPMSDGDVLELRVTNVNQIWHIASAAAQSLAYMPYAFY